MYQLVVAAQFVQHGAQFGELLRECRERPVLLAGMVPAQRRAEGQAMGSQFARTRLGVLRVQRAVCVVSVEGLAERVEFLAEPDVHFDQLIAESHEAVAG
ncbi:hypothetical protein [Actinomadura sp. KC06]|uniref:hypothetical protein n=1 Tax=Actinomadura sp. KC06 TaxID=2530369 RepID=UPI001FB76F17|nr:hypothetical protein [Actinomadura sp. KC06]